VIAPSLEIASTRLSSSTRPTSHGKNATKAASLVTKLREIRLKFGLGLKSTSRHASAPVSPSWSLSQTVQDQYRHVAVGALVWTDGHKSYKWMGEGVGRGELFAASGFRWDWVNHSKGEFSRPQANGDLGPVSTNGVEGLFGRLKRHLRQSGVTKISKRCYAKYLGEFLWREKYLSRRNLGTHNWRPHAFSCFAGLWLTTV
jgi:hypothetical protein